MCTSWWASGGTRIARFFTGVTGDRDKFATVVHEAQHSARHVFGKSAWRFSPARIYSLDRNGGKVNGARPAKFRRGTSVRTR